MHNMLPCNAKICTDVSSEPRVGKSPELKEKSSFLHCVIPYIRTVVRYQTQMENQL
jgi:hypothetical protein